MKHNLLAGLSFFALLALMPAAGCSLPETAVWLYVDNTGEQPLTVSVDGKQPLRVGPGKFEQVRQLLPGQHKVVIRREGEVVFDDAVELKASEQFGSIRKFLINPDGGQRYAIYTAEYGHNPFKGTTRSIVGGMMGKMPTDTQFDFHDLLKQVKPLPAEKFLDIGHTQFVLEDPPDSVQTSSSSAERTVLTRIAADDHDKLMAARDNLSPTRADVKRLTDVCERVMFAPQDE